MTLRNQLEVDLVLKINNRGFAEITQTPLQPSVYIAICHVVVQKLLNVQQHGRLVVKNCENSQFMWTFVGVWVICGKPPFLHSLNVSTKMFANSLTALNQQTLGRANHVHCFQIQLMQSWLVWFWVDTRTVCFFLYKK